MVAVAQRLDRRLDNVLRRAEVRLADAEIDDVLAGCRKRGGAGKHGEGIFLADAVEGGNRLEHVRIPTGAVTAILLLRWSRA